ncbi:ABC transporter [Cryptosporidium ubiquitum]|uniref:ABC transporter n=1 Tax=Cryptosporidium ubiquitum TaxID=857276 RepID=A0A1J4MDB3_9CRYT|nr:ABC transporter [Cryptosporidium ubiquitum]OII72234.1 ABC transporter [Cryptosporidium ubiquitum]
MYTLLGDPFFFRINKLNIKIWENVEFDLDKLKNYVGKQYKVEVDSKRINDKFKLYCKTNHHAQTTQQNQSGSKISTWNVIWMIFSAFKSSYTILLLLKFSLMLATFFLAYFLKKFKESIGVGSEYVKGVSLIINHIIEILFNIYVDYYTEVLHIRVRGSLTLFLMNLMLKNKRLNNKRRESLFNDTQDFSKIQNIVSVDGEFAEYIVSYGMELITFPFSLLLLFGITNMFIDAKSISICALILLITGAVSIASQWISSSYKKNFMEAREERISCLTKSISQNDDFILTHINDTLFMNLVERYRSKEMKFNKYRKLWYCVGEIVSHWMEILCSMAICIYCYYKNYTGPEVMSILTNCSFIIPILVKPISSIAYMTYYISEATNAINRIKDFLCDFDSHSCISEIGLHNLSQTRMDDIEQIEIQDLCSGENIVLRKGCLNIVFDCEKDNPSRQTLNFLKEIAKFSVDEDACSSKFLVRCKLKGSKDLVSLNGNREIARLTCYISKKSWILDNAKLEELIICDKTFDYHLWNLVVNICQLDTDIYNKSININDTINSKQISTGQRIRISFARSLYNKLVQSSRYHIGNPEKSDSSSPISPTASTGPLGRNYCIFYLIENIFDSLDRETSCRMIYSLFNKDEKLTGILNSSFGIISISPDLLNMFFFTVYFRSCKSLIFEDGYKTLLEYNQKCLINVTGITEDLRIVSHRYIGMKDLISEDPAENEDLLNYINYFVNNNIKEPLFLLNNIQTETHLTPNSNTCNGLKRENKIDIEKDVKNLISLKNGRWVSSSLKYYLFQTNDKIRYKFDTKMNKISSIKRNKSLIFVYLLFSIAPLLIFKITEYNIINNLNKTTNMFKDLLKYLHYSLFILVNFVITIFLEIYIGLKSANYIHNTILYGYLTSYSIIKIIPVSSIINHLSNDQLVIDYCITKRIGQILHHINKIAAFVIISFTINFKEPMTYIPIGFIYIFFIYWNYLSYFINSCRTLRLLFLNCQTAISDLTHSINLGIDDIHQNHLSSYLVQKCNQRARELVAPLYCQNMMFAWLRLRLDFLLPVTLTSINILFPVLFSSLETKNREISQMVIFIIGVGLTIPKITSSTVKYWVKMENELLAVTRMKLLMEAIQDDRFGSNLEIDHSTENSSLLMTLKNVDCRHLRLKNDPFSSVMNNYSDLIECSCLKRVNLEIRVGDVIGIVGRTGSGKTTLLKVIGGIIEAYKGTKTVHRGLLVMGDEDEQDKGLENIVQGGLLGLEDGLRKEVQDSGRYLSLCGGSVNGRVYCHHMFSDEDIETKNYKEKQDDFYRMKESSLERIKIISEISEVDPNILLNSVKMLEFLSTIAYVPIKVDFPGNLKLIEVLDSEKIRSSLEILDLLDLFGLVDKKKNLLYDQLAQNEDLSSKSYESCSLLLSPLNLQILDLPISNFNFNQNQKRMLLLLRLALNSQNYRLLLLDELPNYRLTTEDGGYISVIDFILKKYFSNCSVVITTHHFDQISSINRLLVTNNNRRVSEIF